MGQHIISFDDIIDRPGTIRSRDDRWREPPTAYVAYHAAAYNADGGNFIDFRDRKHTREQYGINLAFIQSGDVRNSGRNRDLPLPGGVAWWEIQFRRCGWAFYIDFEFYAFIFGEQSEYETYRFRVVVEEY